MKPSDYIRRGWCQGAIAEDASGQWLVTPASLYAVKWCIIGALRVCNTTQEDLIRVGEYLGDHPGKWNDTPGRTQEEVIAALEAVGL